MSKLGTVGNKIIVKRDEAITQTEGGILLAETAVELPAKGVVFLCGGKVKDVKEKDTVYFSRYVGTEIEFAGTKFLIMREDDVAAWVRTEGEDESN